MHTDVMSKLVEILPEHARAAARTPGSDPAELSLAELGLSSMQMLRFMMAMEDSFPITFDDAELAGIPQQNLGDIARTVTDKARSADTSA